MVSSYYLGKPVTKGPVMYGHFGLDTEVSLVTSFTVFSSNSYMCSPCKYYAGFFRTVVCTLPHIFSLIDNLAWGFYFYI